MDFRAVFLSILVFHFGGASYIIKQIRLRNILASSRKCDKDFYFDPYLGVDGRCQPCSEICGGDDSKIGSEDACERHKDQCEVAQEESTAVPSLTTSDSTAPTVTPSSDPTIVIVIAVATVSLAVLTTGVLVWFIFRNYGRRRPNVETENRTSAPRLIKPVESISFRASKDKICINMVNKEPVEAYQMALLQNQTNSLDQNETNHNGVVCHESSVCYDARNVQTASF